MTGPRPACYTEAHSALNGPLLSWYLLAPAAAEAACLAAGLAFGQPWFFVIMGWLLVPVLISSSPLYRNWPTGIRLDEAGISIGATSSDQAACSQALACETGWADHGPRQVSGALSESPAAGRLGRWRPFTGDLAATAEVLERGPASVRWRRGWRC